MGAARISGCVLGKTNRSLKTTRQVMTIGVRHFNQFDVTTHCLTDWSWTQSSALSGVEANLVVR
jgi:hypothetical protein